MLLDAARTYDIDLNASWMIGDSDIDIEAGRRAGCKQARILHTNEAAQISADLYAASLLEVTRLIVDREQDTRTLLQTL